MKKTLALLAVLALTVTMSIADHAFKVDPANFDGAKLLERYSNLKLEDFRAEIRNGEMYIVFRDGAPIPATPVFEASDPTKRDRLAVLRGMLRSGNLNVSQINEYLRLTAGL